MRQPGRALLGAIVALELLHAAVASWRHLVPSGHDGFQYFTLQYFFLNNAVQSHEVPQWMPFMTHGTVATLLFTIQSSFLQLVLLSVAPIVRSADFLTIYHAGFLVDEMILLTGTWLLARRFFSVPSAFFIAVSVVGSCVWVDQPYWNFRLFYALPLVIELGHRFLDAGRWRWAFLAGNLLAMQTIGNLPYFIPFASFVVVAYFAWYTAANFRQVWTRLSTMRWGWPAAVAVVLIAMSFLVAYGCLTVGTDQLVSYNGGRNADASTDLAGFLTYGGLTQIRQWREIVLRVSPWLDTSLYAGILLAPLVLCGLIRADRRRLHLVGLAGTLLLFTLATPVSSVLFFVWPGMKFFRHIGLVSSVVKVLLCFVAGIGFEWLFETKTGQSRWSPRAGAVLAAAVLIAAGWFTLTLAHSSVAVDRYIAAQPVARVDRPLHSFDREEVARRLRTSGPLALAGAAVVGVVPFLLGGSIGRRPRAREAIVLGVLALVAADVYEFKFANLLNRSDPIGPGERFLVRSATMTFPRRRVLDLHQARETNLRLAGTLRFSPLLRRRFDGLGQAGAQYWTNNAFWFVDEINHTFQADSWLRPMDQFEHVFMPGPPLEFPSEWPAAAALGGLSADKIRFFAHAYNVPSVDAMAPLLADRAYTGGLLFVSAPEAAGLTPWTLQQSLSSDDSQQLDYEVRQFDANNLVVNVSNPEPSAGWMFYSDVWHPSWHATVNGHDVPVYQANVAYKAVALEHGDNIVHFHFGSPLFSVLSALVTANAAFWLCATLWMFVGAFLTTDSG